MFYLKMLCKKIVLQKVFYNKAFFYSGQNPH